LKHGRILDLTLAGVFGAAGGGRAKMLQKGRKTTKNKSQSPVTGFLRRCGNGGKKRWPPINADERG
jgi:hypothetical protein